MQEQLVVEVVLPALHSMNHLIQPVVTLPDQVVVLVRFAHPHILYQLVDSAEESIQLLLLLILTTMVFCLQQNFEMLVFKISQLPCLSFVTLFSFIDSNKLNKIQLETQSFKKQLTLINCLITLFLLYLSIFYLVSISFFLFIEQNK